MPLRRLFPLILALMFLWSVPAAAQRVPHGQDKPPGPALSPTEALARMTVPEGFTVELVAAEPDLVNPVAMTFDERGRIWVTESLEYPRREAGPGRDRVKILEDTDGDGRVDQTTLFLEGLNIPSGIAIGYGGVWVANAPDILFVQDTDGDGRADRQEVVVTGFGRSDTHELPNSLTWGPDGWLYGLNGVFNHSHVKYPAGSPLESTRPEGWQFTVAMFRIHPRTREFQLFAEGTSNPWGIAFDSEGSAFVSACVIDHLWHIVETGYYHRQAGPYPPDTWKIESIVQHKHQKAAYCGLTWFDSDAYPAAYRDKLYMGNIHGNCINSDALQRRGSTYFATPEDDFLSANDAWFMPVAQKTGPDGCLYVLDWYDQYHCYQDANRDPAGIERAKGRLYRVRHDQSPRQRADDLSRDSSRQLVQRLANPNIYVRETAQRLLAERADPQARSPLESLVRNDALPRKTRLHALWALLGADMVSEELHQALLADADSALRAWGVRAASTLRESHPAILEAIIERSSQDEAHDVLLQTAIAARTMKFPAGAEEGPRRLAMLFRILERAGDDPLLARIVWQSLQPLLANPGDALARQIELSDPRRSPAVAAILPRIAERIVGDDAQDHALLARFFLVLEGRDVNAARGCLAALARRIQNGEIRDESLASLRRDFGPTLARFIRAGASHPLGFDAALLAVSWNDNMAIDTVRRTVQTTGLAPAQRLSALAALVAARDDELYDLLPTLLAEPLRPGPQGEAMTDAAFRSQVIGHLSRFDDPRTPHALLAAYPALPSDVQPVAINALTQRAGWAKLLLETIGQKRIPSEALNVNQVRKLLAARDPELTSALQKQWGTLRAERDPRRDAVVARMRALIRRHPGDAVRGRQAYLKVCGQCHKLFGEGQEVGPDITLNGRNSYEQLLSNVFDPSLVIGAAYQAHTVVTTQGRVLSGLVAEESDPRLVLKVQGGKLETLPRADIEEMTVSELSLMPEDVEKTLTPQEIVDLFAYITLDKPPDDPTGKQLAGLRDVAPREETDPVYFEALLAEVAPGFSTAAVGERGMGLLREHFGRQGVVRTHPVDRGVPCRLTRTYDLPADRPARLLVGVSHDPQGDWQLIVRVNGETLFDGVIGAETTKQGWKDLELDLSRWAGEQVELQLDNHSNDWSYEFGYWGKVELELQEPQ
ncbi:MAG: PVC-type heme-binding CxxCH protein [Planctomycetales bacterium]